MDALRIDSASVVGHSLGSFVALELALAAPSRIEHVGLLGSAAHTRDHELVAQMRNELIEGAWAEGVRSQGTRFPDDAFELPALAAGKDAEAWISSEWVTEAGAPAALLAAILPETLATPLGTWIGIARALGTWDLRDRLAAIDAPTLVLSTSGDTVFPEQPYQQELRRALGDRPTVRFSQLETINTTLGHNFHWAAPTAVATELARFLPRGGA
jgi:pimeloyl-ACP methyl ester carboxylesterase